ncbi:T9SS type A sorting domain-containing protein [Bacteroidota bacterium]
MKNLLVMTLASFLSIQAISSQDLTDYYCNFNPPCENLFFDTIQDQNIWIFNKSNVKPGFSHLYPSDHCIMTDSADGYPRNNQSEFILKYDFGNDDDDTHLQFSHYFNTTRYHDGGIVEVSYDRGLSWTNVLNDSVYIHYNPGDFYSLTDTLHNGEPGFSGSSIEIESNNYFLWQTSSFSWYWEHGESKPEDGVYVKFKFISDSIDDSKPGWIINYISLYGGTEGVFNRMNKVILVYPNPSSHEITIDVSGNVSIKSIDVIDMQGRKVLNITSKMNSTNKIDVRGLQNGIYFLQIYTDSKTYNSKFIKVNLPQ